MVELGWACRPQKGARGRSVFVRTLPAAARSVALSSAGWRWSPMLMLRDTIALLSGRCGWKFSRAGRKRQLR
jgi:hypothetical protein